MEIEMATKFDSTRALTAQQFAPVSWQDRFVSYTRAALDCEICDMDDDEELEFLVDAMALARNTFLTTPAPDPEALERKLAVFFVEQCWAFGEDLRKDIMKCLLGDIRGIKEAEVQGDRIVFTVPSGKDKLEVSMTLDQFMAFDFGARAVIVEFFKQQGQHCDNTATARVLPLSRRAAH
jgi:hypothetical protein